MIESDQKRDIFATRLFSRKYKWFPRRLGLRRRLFCASRIISKFAPLAGMIVDTPEIKGDWKQVGQQGMCASMFALLNPLYEKYGCTFVYVTLVDGGAAVVPHWDHSIQMNRYPAFNPSLLRVFEQIPCDQGGPQCMALFFEEANCAIVFYRYETFEIDFYGPDIMWEEFSLALYGEVR